MGSRHLSKKIVAPSVGLYITAGYWFTSSTSFANPSVTFARGFTDTFTGISPEYILPFVCFQIWKQTNGRIYSGLIPVKVSVKPLANVTDGFANDVEDVNQ